MQIKRYIFSFVFCITLLGVIQNNRSIEANQEIVLQVESHLQNEEQADQSLALVSDVLKQIGADAIVITEKGDGLYRISYYSDTSVNQIKQILAEQNKIALEKSSKLPSKEQQKSYDFDVFKIESGQTKSWDFEGQEVYTLQLKSDRSFSPDVFKFSNFIEVGDPHISINSAINANRYVVFASDNTSYNIPEVRAGPLT